MYKIVKSDDMYCEEIAERWPNTEALVYHINMDASFVDSGRVYAVGDNLMNTDIKEIFSNEFPGYDDACIISTCPRSIVDSIPVFINYV